MQNCLLHNMTAKVRAVVLSLNLTSSFLACDFHCRQSLLKLSISLVRIMPQLNLSLLNLSFSQNF